MHLRRFNCLLVVLSLGCNALDSSADTSSTDGDPGAAGRGSVLDPAGEPVADGFGFGDVGNATTLDDSAVMHADTPPPPIEGGTLIALRDDKTAVAGDPDRDRLLVIGLDTQRVEHEIKLEAGARPGRMVEDAAGRVHVLLAGSHEIATLDVREGALGERQQVCGVPRGLAYQAEHDELLVACASGELLRLPAAGGELTESRFLTPDLRDVVVAGDRLFVSTFKRAELIEVGADGELLEQRRPRTLTGPFKGPFGFSEREQTLEPAVAWRSLAGPDGQVVMIHQRAQIEEVPIGEHDSLTAEGTEPSEAMGVATPESAEGEGGYGGGSGGLGCDAIVQGGVTVMGKEGAVLSLPPIAAMVLPVDGAMSPDGRLVAVAVAGAPDNGFAAPLMGARMAALVVDVREPPPEGTCIVPGFDSPSSVVSGSQGIAVAFDGGGRLLVQTREPNSVKVFSDPTACRLGECEPDIEVALGGEPMRDTGHDLFHMDAGRGIACASCHPGGGDDGRTWLFEELGPRRTQLFTMGIKDTEPLHWDGDMKDFSMLVNEVFVRRMGGTPQSDARIDALADWIEALSPHPPLRSSDDPAVARGKALFESDEVGCAGCHNGAKLTNNQSADVGTGGSFQVPSLINVAYHQPFIHTGCAETLRDRFDPACGGGDLHGHTSQLSEGQVDDLVAYLESL